MFALAACDTDALRDDVDNLKDRVESLEAQVSLLNDNMTAIKRLLEGGQTITEVTNTDGTYKLKLSNGETISLTQGSKGEVAYPEITVNDEGQWVVNGEVLMQNGIPVQAVGTPGKDGIAPKFHEQSGPTSPDETRATSVYRGVGWKKRSRQRELPAPDCLP